MRLLKCQNTRVGNGGKETRCGYDLVSVPEWLLTSLSLMEGDPEGKIVVRCRWCRGNRWAEIKFENKQLVFKSLSKKPDLGKPVEFGDVSICCQALIIKTQED